MMQFGFNVTGRKLKHALFGLANVGREDAVWQFFQSRRVEVALIQYCEAL